VTQPLLTVGVMLDDTAVPAWIEFVLLQLLDAEFVDLRLFILNGEELPRRPRGRHLLYRLYERADARLFGSPEDAFAERELGAEFAHVKRLTVVPRRPKPYEHRFSPEDVAAIRAEGLDVVLRFGFAILRGEILEVARYGIWSFHHGDNREYRGGPAFFWEMAQDNPVTGVVLQILTDELDSGHVIYRSVSATDPSSLRRGRTGPYWKGAHFVLRRLRDLHEGGWDSIRALPTYSEKVASRTPIYTLPNNRETARFVLRTGSRFARRHLARTREEWFVGWRRRDGPPGRPQHGAPFVALEPPPGEYFSDPFLLERDGRTYIFFEHFVWATGRAHVSSVELTDAGPTVPRFELARPHHLSYPFVFEHEDEVFMVPEAGDARTIELVRAATLPGHWEPVATLMDDVEAYDTTLLRRDGRWWLFVTIAMPGGPKDNELFVFYAPTLDSEWTAHPLNPVVSDVRCARPAGRIFERDGRLIRPAQDCSGRYGRAIVWREITHLGTLTYRERTIGRFDPESIRGAIGTHTYDVSERYEVTDWLEAVPANGGARRPALRPGTTRPRAG
jgi:hypothetical protein